MIFSTSDHAACSARNGTWHPRGIAIVPTEPWEEGGLRNFTGTATPLGNGEWRLWYYARSSDRRSCEVGIAEGVPGSTAMRKHRLVRSASDARKVDPFASYSLSNLPDGWLPVQPVYIALPGGGHRLYFWAHAPGIVRYLCAESDDGCHFTVTDPHRAVLYHYHDRAVEKTSLAADGLTFWGNGDHLRPAKEPSADPALVTNDATNLYVLPDGSWELFTACILPIPNDSPRYIPEDNAAGFVRVIDRFTSTDGLCFGGRRRVLAPDSDDPPGLQFYSLAVTHLPDGRRLGHIGHYRADLQMMMIEQAWSNDGLVWERPSREPCIGPGFNGASDLYGTGAGHNVVWQDGNWWCFYTGFRHTHNFKKSAGSPGAHVVFATCDALGI